MSYNFQEQVSDNRQDVACKAVADHWRGLGYDVLDVSKNPDYYKEGIDLIRTIMGEDKITIDVKCDFIAHYTGNFPVELVEIMGRDNGSKRGWAYKESLDEIHFYVWETKLIVPVKRKILLGLAYKDGRKGYASFHEKPFPYFTLGILVPINDILENN